MYYFAYGSNMNLEHMRKLCGWNFTIIGTVYLSNYNIAPDFRGYINIKPENGKKVYGVLYKVTQDALDALDEFEGYPSVFNREMVTVMDDENNEFQAWVYIEAPGQFGGNFVKAEYLNRVISGATQNHLPPEWISYLENFGNN